MTQPTDIPVAVEPDTSVTGLDPVASHRGRLALRVDACRRAARFIVNLRRNGGFTLVELLGVILIIAILLGLSMTVVMSAIEDSRYNSSRTDAYEIANAIVAYFHEYGMLPVPDPPEKFNGTSDSWFFAQDQKTTSQAASIANLKSIYKKLGGTNPKQIVFLKRDIPAEGYFHDAWGNPFLIALDLSYDGNVKVNSAYYKHPTDGWGWYGNSISAAQVVMVRSPGKDKEIDESENVSQNTGSAGGGAMNDDIITFAEGLR